MSEELFDMTDEELEEAFKAARAEMDSPDLAAEDDEDFENDYQEDDELEGSEEDDFEEEPEDDEADEDPEDDGLGEGSEPAGEDGSGPTGVGQEDEKDDGTSEEVAKKSAPQTRTFRAAGQEYSFTDAEIMERFPAVFGQAMDYTRKMQAIKPWRKTIDALEQAKVSQEDLNLAIDVLKGNKEAIGEVLRRHELDSLDISVDEEAEYTPQSYGRDAHELAIRDTIQEIQHDPEFATTRQVLENGWDDASWNWLTEDPNRIRQLHIDVKSGMFDQLQAEAQKLKVFDGGRDSDVNYYMKAAETYFRTRDTQALQNLQQQRQVQEQEAARIAAAKEAEQKRATSSRAASARRAAAPTTTRTRSRGPVNYLDASDEDFEQWYKQLQDKI